MRSSTFIIWFSLMLGTYTSQAKPDNDLLKANYLYSHLAFHEAIGYYQKVAPNLNDPAVLAKLGDCYRLTKDPAQAATWYAKAVATNGCPAEVRLHYAQVLMNLSRYSDALPLLQQYAKQKPGDRRVANMITSCQKAPEMMNRMPNGSIVFENFNINGSSFGPALRNNELFFTADTSERGKSKTDEWTGHPFYKIYSVSCDGTGQCNKQLKELGGEVNTKYHDGPCTFNATGSTMYFTRTNYIQKFLTKSPVPDNNNVVHLEIMMATDYDAAKGTYKKITPFQYNSKDYSVAHPAISKDENILVFSSDKENGEGGTDLYMCLKDNSGKWSCPKNLGTAINTEGDELFPSLDKDNTLYFASDGHVGYGGLDIYEAKWDKATNSFSEPVNMGMPLNSPYDDMSLVLTDNSSTGYFASDRPGYNSGDNIYSFNRQGIFLSVKAIDELTGQAISNATVALKSEKDSRVLASLNNGSALTQLFPKTNYMIEASAPGYNPASASLSTSGITSTDTIRKVIKLKHDLNISYSLVVLNEKTREPIENPSIVFLDDHKYKTDTIMLATGSTYTVALQSGHTYHTYALKENYYANEKVISTKGINPNAGGVVIKDTIFMKQLQVGEIYNIDNIYYDYNKANIRQDAKPSLNRLLEVLNQYPKMGIQVNAHTDCRGSDSYNMKLSNARAHAVINYLQQKGIPASRLHYKGYGESMPIVKCPVCERCTEADHQKNRRTEFQILSM